jgi:ectoine hydroxylase-related dioxygenase (phytanoyl-CoA dioxygenase family)
VRFTRAAVAGARRSSADAHPARTTGDFSSSRKRVATVDGVLNIPRLTAEQEAAFHAHGHLVLPGLFTTDEVAVVRGVFERLHATAQRLRTTQEHDGASFVLRAPPDGDVIVQRVVWAGGAEPALLSLSADPRLVDPALQLLSTKTCEQLLCQAHFKMPHDGVSFDWHQDIQHRDKGGDTWRDVNGRGSYVQTILLVDDMRADNGPLLFLPDAAVSLDERGRLVRAGDTALPMPAPTAGDGYPSGEGSPVVDASRALTVTGRAGDVLVFGPWAVHGSRANTSDRPRRVLINGYAAPGANRRVYPGRGACRRLPLP